MDGQEHDFKQSAEALIDKIEIEVMPHYRKAAPQEEVLKTTNEIQAHKQNLRKHDLSQEEALAIHTDLLDLRLWIIDELKAKGKATEI